MAGKAPPTKQRDAGTRSRTRAHTAVVGGHAALTSQHSSRRSISRRSRWSISPISAVDLAEHDIKRANDGHDAASRGGGTPRAPITGSRQGRLHGSKAQADDAMGRRRQQQYSWSGPLRVQWPPSPILGGEARVLGEHVPLGELLEACEVGKARRTDVAFVWPVGSIGDEEDAELTLGGLDSRVRLAGGRGVCGPDGRRFGRVGVRRRLGGTAG